MIPETGKRDYSISQRNNDSGVIAQLCFSLPWFTITILVEEVKSCYCVDIYCSLLLCKTATCILYSSALTRS